ncbi:MAG: Na(+)-translocating NADH-quinone reductase subunit A [Planctomycetaceae bacterium]
MKTIRITRGLDVPISGVPEQRIESGPAIQTVALQASDYRGMKPTMLVKEGDRVQTGTPVFEDKKLPGVLYTAPACGVVKGVNRGAKRAFQSVVIAVDGDDSVKFDVPGGGDVAKLGRAGARELLLKSGLWPAFRRRPFSKTPSPDSVPHSIFVQAIDTAPLAANPAIVIAEHLGDFERGLQVIQQLTDGDVHLCVAAGANIPGGTLPSVVQTQFDGPHPAGLPGTHIHFLDPVSAAKSVWHIGYADVIAIGKLLSTGKLWTERVVALAGPQVTSPRLLRTRLGASLAELTAGQLKAGENRVVSGSVLSGRQMDDVNAYLGRFHLQVSVLKEGRDREFLGWQMPGADKFSVKNIFVSALAADGRRYDMTTNRNGSRRAIVPIGAYEKVMPLDILPTALLKALLSGDTDLAQGLGALELDEEDLALCTFVDPGKHEFGPVLRQSLQRIEIEG